MKWEDEPTLLESFKLASDHIHVWPYEQPLGETSGHPSFQQRVPFRYETESGTVHLGQPGWFHHNIDIDRAESPGPFADGYIWNPPGSVDWYDHAVQPPDDYERMAVHRALSRHLGVPLREQKQQDYGDDSFWQDA